MRFGSALALLAVLSATAQTDPGFWRDDFAVPGAYLGDGLDGHGAVYALADDGAGGVYAGGRFRNVDGVTVSNVARWTGAEWVSIGGVEGDDADVAIYALEPLSDGSLAVAGEFSRVVGPDGEVIEAGGVARWDGGTWTGLGSLDLPLDRGRGAALAEASGVLYVAGVFTSITNPDGSTVEAHSLARWTGAGWESFGGNGAALTIGALPNGDLIVGGAGHRSFSGPDGVPVPGARGVARWDGNEWSAVGGGAGVTSDDLVAVVEPTGGETFVVGGTLDRVFQSDGTALAVENVAQWDGDEWVGIGGVSSPTHGGHRIVALAQAADGLYLVGDFDTVVSPDGTEAPAAGIARWAGGVWTAIPDAHGEGRSLLPLGDGVAVGWRRGGFKQVGAGAGGQRVMRAYGLAAYGPDGWRPLSSRFDGANMAGSVRALGVDPCGDLVVAGGTGAGVPGGLSRWNGTLWDAPWGGVASNGGGLRAVLSDGACTEAPPLYVGGGFEAVSGPGVGAPEVAASGVAHWDGAAWEPLGGGVVGGAVWALARDADGVYVGGDFDVAVRPSGESLDVGGVARWDGAEWYPLGGGARERFHLPGPAPTPGGVRAVAPGPGGEVVIGGSFDDVIREDGSVLEARGLALWSAETGWRSVGNLVGDFDRVWALVWTDGGLVVGGSFGTIVAEDGPPVEASNVARWDGAAWHPLGEGLPSSVTSLEVDAQGRLFATAYSPYLWTGEEWVRVGGGVSGGAASSLAAAPDGVLYVGGGDFPFTVAGGIPSPRLAAYDVASATSTASGPGGPPAGTVVGALHVSPNPSGGTVTLRFETGASGEVRLVVCDVLGREVAVVHEGPLGSGPHAVTLDMGAVPSGTYVATLVAPWGTASRVLTVAR